jgi:hypothetical protein
MRGSVNCALGRAGGVSPLLRNKQGANAPRKVFDRQETEPVDALLRNKQGANAPARQIHPAIG